MKMYCKMALGSNSSQNSHLYLQEKEKKAWIQQQHDVALGSDAFFPFGDNIERAYKSGVKYVVQPGGSIRE